MRSLIATLMLLATPVPAQTPLPFDVGGPYVLVDQHGDTRTQADPDGQPQLLFFGYANCPGICSAALPLMGNTVAALADEGIALRPVMITVDPLRDTVSTMGTPLAEHHPSFVGLTGDAAALNAAYTAFSVEHALAYQDPQYGPVYTHGSMIYLMDAKGDVLTLIPPVIAPDKAVEIALSYLRKPG